MSFVKKVIFGSCHVLLLLKSVDVKEFSVCLLSCHYDCLRARAFFFFHLFSWSISSRYIFFSEMCSNDSRSSSSGNMCMMTEWDASFSGESTVNPEFDVDSDGTSSSTTIDLSMLPIDMTFNDGHIVSIATYSVLLIISVCGNITVLVNLIRRRHISNPRVNIMLTHLAIADLLVSSKFSSYFCFKHVQTFFLISCQVKPIKFLKERNLI